MNHERYPKSMGPDPNITPRCHSLTKYSAKTIPQGHPTKEGGRLKLCELPETEICITASVRPWVGRIAPSTGGQSICAFVTPIIASWRSGMVQTWPSDHGQRSRSFFRMRWVGILGPRQAIGVKDPGIADPG